MAGIPDPKPAFRYCVEIDGIIEAAFVECAGLNIEREVFAYQEGGVNDFVHQLPGRTRYTNITLKRGMTASSLMWEWYAKGLFDAKVDRRNISILLFGTDGELIFRWNVIEAFPVKCAGPALNAQQSAPAIESFELAHHGIRLVKA